MTRKKVVLTVIVVILIALVAFCLIYTRPKSLSSMLNDREITNISALVVEGKISNGTPYYDKWELQGDMITDQILKDLVSLMEHDSYRTSLRTLVHPDTYDLGSNSRTVHLGVMLEDGTHVTIIYSGSAVRFSGDRYINALTDPSVCRSLAEYIIEYGAKL